MDNTFQTTALCTFVTENSLWSLKLTLLSHLLVLLSGNESSPGFLNDPGKSVKLSFPHLLEEEKLWGQIKLMFDTSIAVYLVLSTHTNGVI